MSSGRGVLSYASLRPLPDLGSQTSSRHPCGLVRLVEATGRTKGSSASPLPPSLGSSTPDRELESREPPNNFNNSFNNTTPNSTSLNVQVYTNSSPRYDSAKSRSGGGYTHNTLSRTKQSSPTPCYGLNNRNGNPPRMQYGETQNQGSGSNLRPNMSTSQSSAESSYDMPPQTADGHLSAQLQAILLDVQQKFARLPSIPQVAQDNLNQQLIKMGRDFSESQRHLQQDLDQVKGECDDLRGQLDETRQQLDSVIQDRARISTERDGLQLKVSELGMKSKKNNEKIGDTEARLKQVNKELLERIRIQEEQLKGKRALWMDSNPNSASRRSAMNAIQDPFSSPTPNQTSGFDGGVMDDMELPPLPIPFPPLRVTDQGDATSTSWSTYAQVPLMKLPPVVSGPSGYLGTHSRSFPSGAYDNSNSTPPERLSSRRRPSTQLNNSVGNGSVNSSDAPSTLRRSNTEPNESSTAGQFNGDEDPSLEFKTSISRIYQTVQTWVREHACIPNLENDQAIPSENRKLWSYMMKCIYQSAHRQEAHAHVVNLLADPDMRSWFIMRIALTYCVQDIMSVDSFKSFSPKVSEAVEDAKNKLQERGLANDARQILIDRISEALKSVVAAPSYATFRSEQMSLHTKCLRDILGPLLNTGCSRSLAGKELGAVVIKSWDLSVKMHTCRLTFQVYFPDTMARFNAATMLAMDSDVDPVKLQIQQVRLNLVITPVITMRDDRGTTIKAKNLHLANVLLLT